MKPEKLCSACKCNHGRLDSLCICESTSSYLTVWHGYFSLLIRPVDQQWRQMAVRFYSKCYCTTSEVDMLARRFRLASNRYIVCKSANVKECQYQVIISYGLFEETNEQRIFKKRKINKLNSLYIIFNEKSFWWTE